MRSSSVNVTEVLTHDFYIGKNLRNLPALRRIGLQANRRLLQVQRISHDCILAEEAFQKNNRPAQVTSPTRLRTALRRSQGASSLACPLAVSTPAHRLSNRRLRQHFASLVGQPPDSLNPGQMTYHLRRLRLHGIVERIPQTHHYRITDLGLRTGVVLHSNLQPHSPPWTRIHTAGALPTQLLAPAQLRQT
jgi:hypothetical protein